MSTASDMVTTIDTAISAIVTKKAESYEVAGIRYTVLNLDDLKELRAYYEGIASGETAAASANPRFQINPLKAGDAK